MSTTGFEKRIALTCPHFSRGQVKKAAKQLAHLAARLQAEEEVATDDGFYHALRTLGIHADPTARDGIRAAA